MRVRTSATERLSAIVLELRDARGRVVGRSRAASFRGRRPVGIVLRHALSSGRYRVVGRAIAANGSRVSAAVRFRLR